MLHIASRKALRFMRFVQPSLTREGYMLDEIDIELLKQTSQNPGQPFSNAVKPLLVKRKERTLYDRLIALEKQELIEVDRSKKKVALSTITEKGKAAIKGREISALLDGGRSP